MVSLAHSFAGATIAYAFPNPAVYIPLALISHYILDAIPHYDLGSTIKNYKKNKKTSIFLAFADVFIALVAIVGFGYLTHKNLNFYSGALFGILPDIVEAPLNFFNKKFKILLFFNKIHGKYHHNSKKVFNGIFPQAIVMIASILLMINF